MDRNSISNGINRSWTALEKLGLAESFSNSGPLGVNPTFRDLVLSEESRYVDIYSTGLSLSHYNILLTDYSYFQFSWDKKDNVRYAYYPNPYVAGKSNESINFKRRRNLVNTGVITQEEYLSMLRDSNDELRVPLIRYENAPEQHKGLKHPCSHMHIGHHGENRWPLNRVLTPTAFTLWITKQYYSDEWWILGKDDQNEFGNILEHELVKEKANCRPVASEYFLDLEARSFYLG
ncbi:DUF2290 domain-containing protein [Myxococcus xanthus]|uniref:DUF2290 domain-containing protein n=1 Tax=Myxococcus xanthus TaxID=34 RepID=UPI00112C8EDD|nr:DUF2290 domain-containing protein [Myxococcus xanthus]